MTTTLQFHQILPLQKMPVLSKKLGKELEVQMPQRAKAFCHPFKAATSEGVYCFSPLDFDFKLDGQQFLLRAKKDDGSYKTIEINPDTATDGNHFVLLSDISPEHSDRCLALYRQRIAKAPVPEHIDIDNFGFYEVLLNVLVEEEPFGVFLQLWLGGVVTTDPATPIWVKQAANVQMDPGFTCLDAVIDVGRWQGWLAIVLKPTRQGEWVSINSEQPVCQLLGYPQPIEQLQTIAMAQVSDEIFSAPLQWHIYDSNYGLKPGKYQRMIKRPNR